MDGPGLNPGVGEIFHIRPDRTWGPPSLLYNGYWVFPGVKRPGRGVDHPPPSSAEVKGGVEIYLYSLSGPSRPVLRWNLLYLTLRSSCMQLRLISIVPKHCSFPTFSKDSLIPYMLQFCSVFWVRGTYVWKTGISVSSTSTSRKPSLLVTNKEFVSTVQTEKCWRLVDFKSTLIRVTSVGGVTVKKKLYCEVLEIQAVSIIKQLCTLKLSEVILKITIYRPSWRVHIVAKSGYFVMSVPLSINPSAWNNTALNSWIFMKFCIVACYSNQLRKLKLYHYRTKISLAQSRLH